VNLFFDTSALIKNYVYEKGSDRVAALVEEADKVIVAPTFEIESASALSRMHNGGAYTRAQANELFSDVEIDVRFFDRVPYNPDLEEASVRATFDHNLRALDSIQLGAAILRRHEIDRFVSCDKDLLAAAKKEKFKVEDPTA
jgi:predicted nucleic acid-binding protein